MRAFIIILLIVSGLTLCHTSLWARTLYLRVASGENEGAIFVYHLKEDIPEKYRQWIVELDTGPEDRTLVIPNLPDRVYKLELPDVDPQKLEEMMRVILKDMVVNDKDKAGIKKEEGAPIPVTIKPKKGNPWE
jgi:hypothetical protein